MSLNVRTKLLATSGFLLLALLVVSVVAIVSLSSVNDRASLSYSQGTVAIKALGEIDASLADRQAALNESVFSGTNGSIQSSVDGTIQADDQAITDSLATFEALQLTDQESTDLAAFKQAKAQYDAAYAVALADAKTGAPNAAAEDLSAITLLEQANGPLDSLRSSVASDTIALKDQTQATFEQGRLLTVAILLIAVVLGLLISIRVGWSITRGVHAVQAQLTLMTERGVTGLDVGMAALARYDLTYAIQPTVKPIEKYGKDEIGQTAEVSNRMLEKVQGTMRSYETARASLADTVAQVKAASDALSRASEQLNLAATQSGTASAQVARTISQVAAGASDQAHAASQTSTASHDLTQIIERVGEGAASTRLRVQEAARAIDATTQAIAGVMRDSDEIAPLNERVDAALVAGASAVEETANGMLRIKTAVDVTAVKVTELGAKGEQIGAIVETIDDIAEQTNLLALNAAIEAARAGEQGKGFAVVADEVRKLAERSSRATKEIADLIAQVQQETRRAVSAMEEGAGQVKAGSELAEKSAAALVEIKNATSARELGLARVLASLLDIRRATGQVVASSDAIAAIAAETTDAARTMSAAATVVSEATNSIAAVSEQNSAAAEEVSAATEEMSAQAQEVVASAASLAQMATRLESLVEGFRFEAGAGDTSVSERGERRPLVAATASAGRRAA
jgi:methyl-accepting chemotaxis protein